MLVAQLPAFMVKNQGAHTDNTMDFHKKGKGKPFGTIQTSGSILFKGAWTQKGEHRRKTEEVDSSSHNRISAVSQRGLSFGIPYIDNPHQTLGHLNAQIVSY